MGQIEVRTASWKSNDGRVRLGVTGLGPETYGPNNGRVRYIWTLWHRDGDETHHWTSRTQAPVFSGVGSKIDANEGMRSLVVFLEAWYESTTWQQREGKEAENAALFNDPNGKLYDMFGQYGDEMYADITMTVMVEDTADPELREYR